MAEASFLAAFLGGVLSLLAPCSALLLPAFFAYAFSSPTQLLARTVLFLLGMITVFVPLGLGASWVAALLIDYRETTILVAGLMLIGFGLLELTGRGFSILPPNVAARFQRGKGPASVYGMGLVYGISGFCAGPLLGAVLTIAAVSGNPLVGGGLLATYALGAATPLFFIAWLWDRFQLGRKSWLRGRPLHVGPWQIHSTNLMAGTLFIVFGATFIAFQGSSGLSTVYDDLALTDAGFRAQDWVTEHLTAIPDIVWLLGVALVVGAAWLVRRWTMPRTRPGVATLE